MSSVAQLGLRLYFNIREAIYNWKDTYACERERAKGSQYSKNRNKEEKWLMGMCHLPGRQKAMYK